MDGLYHMYCISLGAQHVYKKKKKTELLWVFMSELEWEVMNREGAGCDYRSEKVFPPTSHSVDTLGATAMTDVMARQYQQQ